MDTENNQLIVVNGKSSQRSLNQFAPSNSWGKDHQNIWH